MDSAENEDEKVSIKAMSNDFVKSFKHPELAEFMNEIEDPLEGKDLEGMLDRIQKMRNELIGRVDDLYEASSLSKEKVNTYMENPDNFTRSEWEAIEMFKAKTEDYVKEFQVISQGAGIREIVREGRKRAQKKKTKLERKNTSNKKWIPMS